MPHPRTVIRQAVQTALIDAATSAADRVYTNRVLPLRAAELPAIIIVTPDEDVDEESKSTAPRELRRVVDMLVVGQLDATATPDDDLDDLALEIETVMHADPLFEAQAPGVISESILTGTSISIVREGDRHTGLVTLTYEFTYDTEAPEAPDDLDDFETVEATHNLGNDVHEDDEAVDLFTVEE